MRRRLILALGIAALAACDDGAQQPTNQPTIKVRSAEQDALLKLDAMNLSIALKHAIYDAGYTCKRVTDAGFVGPYQNVDMWVARCEYDKGVKRDWAVFAGPDGSAQVRDCKDIAGTEVPQCEIKKRPSGKFS
ncbi:MAG TPA: hypothetical protein VKC17_06645 [Sphingomicrobium sp.]|nr:hypothetical protein [Sphingomicrobium sp.]